MSVSLIKEEWKPIWGFEGYYDVSNLGRVRSVSRLVDYGRVGKRYLVSKILKPYKTTKGYWAIKLCKNGCVFAFSVHVLVAECFVPNTELKDTVNHKDGMKTNNIFTNLEWMTYGENNQHSFDTLLKTPSVKHIVYCVNMDSITFGVLEMQKLLIRRGYVDANASDISYAMHKGIKHSGLTFKSITVKEYEERKHNGSHIVV